MKLIIVSPMELVACMRLNQEMFAEKGKIYLPNARGGSGDEDNFSGDIFTEYRSNVVRRDLKNSYGGRMKGRVVTDRGGTTRFSTFWIKSTSSNAILSSSFRRFGLI